MNRKQFDLFNTAVQWTVDEDRRKKAGLPENGMAHEQGEWGYGILSYKSKTVEVRGELGYRAICPTAGCLAGNIVVTAGDQMVGVVPKDAVYENDHEIMADWCWDGKHLHDIEIRARQLVGISPEESDPLFYAGNTVKCIVELSTVIAERHGHQLVIV